MIIKQAIFDLDGTILQTMDSLIKTGNSMLEQFGYQKRTLEEYRFVVGYGAKELVRRLLVLSGDQQAERLEEAYEIYMKLFDEYCTYQVRPYPGIPELISEFQKRDIVMAVLTNKPHKMTQRVLDTSFAADTFAFVQGQAANLPRKPDPAAALYIAEKIGVTDYRQVLFIGDSDADMQTAVNAGMVPVGAGWGFRTPEELMANGCEILLDHPLDLLDYLD
ncbi:MAG TPA: HAD family hydrolase [Clostridiaceae bacterium]|nr:HAD family hydrolase [Clostridiaceae bacterium]